MNIPYNSMIKFRVKIIECIINAERPSMVEGAILLVIQQKLENGISAKRIIQTIPSLEWDMIFHARLKHTEKELNNIKEALRLFREGINLN